MEHISDMISYGMFWSVASDRNRHHFKCEVLSVNDLSSPSEGFKSWPNREIDSSALQALQRTLHRPTPKETKTIAMALFGSAAALMLCCISHNINCNLLSFEVISFKTVNIDFAIDSFTHSFIQFGTANPAELNAAQKIKLRRRISLCKSVQQLFVQSKKTAKGVNLPVILIYGLSY